MKARRTQPRDIKTSMIQVVSSRFASNRIVALAAQVMAADAKLNDWVLEVARQTMPEKDLMAILEQCENELMICDQAARQFDRDGNAAALEKTLRQVLRRLAACGSATSE